MLRTRSLQTLLTATLGLAALVAHGACTQPSSSSGSSSSSSTGGASGNTSGGFDAGVLSNGCLRDQDCGGGLICSGDGGCQSGESCVAGSARCGECEQGGSLNCGFVGTAYCDSAAGTCRRALSSCEPCTADEQCGFNDQLGLANRCIDDGTGQRFCGLACNGACSPGFQCTAGACQLNPAVATTCSGATPCTSDTQCPAAQHCTTRDANPPRPGVCLGFCLADTECGPGRICQLEPGPNFGACLQACTPGTSGANGTICHAWGRFAAPCTSVPCPGTYECTASGWCDLPGCQSDAECPLSRTICDTSTMSCIDGCRTEADCGAFELCQGGMCVTQGCRGKNLSCNLGQFCCGKELFDTANGGQACPSPVMTGDCFNMPDPFCRRCDDDNGCMDINSFQQASHCYELQRSDADGGTQTVGKFCSVGCRTSDDCPRGIQCRDLPAGQNGEMVKGCIDALCAAFNP